MEEQETTIDYKQLLGQMKQFYPAEKFDSASLEHDIKSGKLFVRPEDFLPYLQTALLDDKLIEVRFDDNEIPHFTKIIDWPAKEKENDSDEVKPYEPVLPTPAAYFLDMSHITSLPIEPGIGNFHIRSSQRVVMRFFTKAFAVEFCTTFLSTDKDKDIPVLQFNFPFIGRLLKGEREYRARVIRGFDLKVHVAGKRKQPDITSNVINVSGSGIAFSLEKKDVEHFFDNEKRKLILIKDGEKLFDVNAKVRHVTRIRKRSSIAYYCGAELDLVTQSLSKEVGSLVATVQRAHLQSLSGMARETGYKLIA